MKYQVLLLIFCLCSCTKHIDEKHFESGDIKASWYSTSEISNMYDHVDLTRRGSTENIMRANTGGIHDIIINNDTLIIRVLPKIGIYDLVALKHGVYIKIDSTVTTYEYMKKHQPENAKYYEADTLKNKPSKH